MQFIKYLFSVVILNAATLMGSNAYSQTTIYFDLKQGTRPCPTTQVEVVAQSPTESETPQAAAYPNPFSEVVQVKATDGMKAISILDISGKVSLHIDVQGLEELNIKTDHLSNGMYFIIISFENGAKTSLKLCKTY